MDKAYYEQIDLWNKPPLASQSQMQADILNLMPEDVKNTLDVGCGNGYITNALPKHIHVVGTDISMSALQYVERVCVAGSVTHLPFCDKSFDLVQATNVIEHIPEEDYPQTLQEIQRLARKYILIGVPFMENLKSGFTRCSGCGLIYHINHHYRSFGIMELTDLFKNHWKPTVFVFSGADISQNEIYFRAVRSFLGIFMEWSMAICPRCNSKGSTNEIDNRDEQVIASLAKRVPRDYGVLHPNRSHCVVLYEKCQSMIQPTNSREILQLTRNGYRDEIPISVRTTCDEQGLVVETTVDRVCDLNDQLWLVWKLPERVYCYSNPRSIGVNRFLVPLWFSTRNMESFTPSRAFWENNGIKLVSSGIQDMQREIYLRSGIRGAIRTILERFGIKHLK